MNSAKKERIRKAIQVILSFIGVLACAAFSPLFMYFQNAGEAHFIDVAPTMLMFMAVGLVLYAITLLITRNPSKAGIISIAFLVVFLNYAHIESAIQSLLPSLRYWHILPITVVLLIHLGWIIHKFIPVEITEIITPVTTIVLMGLIVINAISAIPDIAGKIAAEKEMQQLDHSTNSASVEKKPNIYFLMFDEYASYDFMIKHYDYDNSRLMEKLEKSGFAISRTSHNDSIVTTTVVPNLMNLDYVVTDKNTEYDKALMWKNGALYSLLKDHGYSLHSILPSYGLPMLDDTQGSSTAVTVTGDSLKDLLLKSSIVYPFVKTVHNDLEGTLSSIESFIKSGEKNRFLAAHFKITHTPFMYEQDGSISNYINSDWKNKQYYLNQYIYASKVIDQLVSCIIKNDPDSIIILQSDHGARASNDPELFKVMFSIEDMSHIFNCVYYQGTLLDIEGLSGVNTHRLVYSKLLNVDLPPVPVPKAQDPHRKE